MAPPRSGPRRDRARARGALGAHRGRDPHRGSMELHRFFAARAPTWEAAGLAGDLALSAYWLLYAAALVRTGFWLEQKAVRSAGLGVAVLAILKIALYDLSNLEAFFRLASVLCNRKDGV